MRVEAKPQKPYWIDHNTMKQSIYAEGFQSVVRSFVHFVKNIVIRRENHLLNASNNVFIFYNIWRVLKNDEKFGWKFLEFFFTWTSEMKVDSCLPFRWSGPSFNDIHFEQRNRLLIRKNTALRFMFRWLQGLFPPF